MIEALEEQSGVSIRYNEDELGLECLEEKTSFELKNTTLKSVIEKVAQMAGWVVEIDDVGVRLVNKK